MLAVFSLISCDDFLSKNPDNRTDINSEEAIASLLVTAYPDYTYVWFTDLMTDNITDVGPSAPYTSVDARQLYTWSTVSSEWQDTPTGFWNESYYGISVANTALEAIDRLINEGVYTIEELDYLKGEALLARAYNHFMLVNLFAEHYDPETAETTLAIPYVTEVEKVPNVVYYRKTVKEIYDAIELDIQEALPYGEVVTNFLIKDNKMSNKSWHFNLKAAATFASRFYLYRGLDTDWEKVEFYAMIGLNNDPVTNLRDWSVAKTMSWDAFSANYARSLVPANYLLRQTVSYGGRAWLYRYTMDLEILRKRAMNPAPHPTNKNATLLFSEMAVGNSSYGTYLVNKIEENFKRSGVNANYGVAYVMYPLIVAEEALFNLAEAKVALNKLSEARELLDVYYSKRVIDYDKSEHNVTDRKIKEKYTGNANSPDITPHFASKLTDEQKIYLKCIVNVRASEFVHEGQRWFDIKRMHIEVQHKIYDGEVLTLTGDDSRRVLTLPDGATSSGLLHNPRDPNAEELMKAPIKPDSTTIDFIMSDYKYLNKN